MVKRVNERKQLAAREAGDQLAAIPPRKQFLASLTVDPGDDTHVRGLLDLPRDLAVRAPAGPSRRRTLLIGMEHRLRWLCVPARPFRLFPDDVEGPQSSAKQQEVMLEPLCISRELAAQYVAIAESMRRSGMWLHQTERDVLIRYFRLLASDDDSLRVFGQMVNELLDVWEWVEDPPGTLARVQERQPATTSE